MKIEILYLLSFLGSLALVFVVMPKYISYLKKAGYNQEVSEYALKEYQEKAKTPIMGGLLFVVAPLLVTLILRPSAYLDPKALFVILSYASFCLIGFLDDFLILLRHNNEGLSPKKKLLAQLVSAALLYLLFHKHIGTSVYLPFLHWNVDLGFLFAPFLVLVFATEANAVNFTDGMDGLCAGVSFFSLIPFVLFALKDGESNLVLLILGVLGALLGYLYYNRFPAKIFMGDSGSLALGALFASLGFILHKEVALFFAGLVFVWEMFCVSLQLFSVIVFHRRIFSYTPIHYAFRLKGISETRIVGSFYLLAILSAAIGLLVGFFG